MEEVMKGRIGGEEGFDIRCIVEDEKIAGRAGGKLRGQDIVLTINDTGVSGTVGSESVEVTLQSGELRGNIGKEQITLRGVDQVTGFFGKPITGWNVVAQQNGDLLIGQLGSTILGRQFQLSLGGTPGWVGVLVAVVAFYALEPRAQASS